MSVAGKTALQRAMPLPTHEEPHRPRQLEAAWDFLIAVSKGAADASSLGRELSIRLEAGAPRGWVSLTHLPAAVAQLLDVYAPLLPVGGAPVRVLAHLGQSIDGYIAGADGESRSLSAHENIVHLHCLRALFQAVVVGANTAIADNPMLTTRLVRGPNPVRVVLDPSLRTDPELAIFSDDSAPTIVVCCSDAPAKGYPNHTHVLRLSTPKKLVRCRDVVAALRAEGLSRIFVEGGGSTVSRWLAGGAVDRMQITVAPLLIGRGVRGVCFTGAESFSDALRPPCTHFSIGSDVLFDFDLRAGGARSQRQ